MNCKSYITEIEIYDKYIKQCCNSNFVFNINDINSLYDFKKINCHKCSGKIYNEYNENNIERLAIFLHNYCNGKCLMCFQKKEKKYITNYKKILKKFKNDLLFLNTIIVLGGEIFLKPDIFIEFINYLKIEFPFIKELHIITNGSFYDEVIIKKLLLQFEKIIFNVSIDGTYETNIVQRGLDYNIISNNIKKINSLSDRIIINISYTLTSINYKKIFEIFDIYNDFKFVNKFFIKPCLYPLNCSLFKLNEKELKVLNNNINFIKNKIKNIDVKLLEIYFNKIK